MPPVPPLRRLLRVLALAAGPALLLAAGPAGAASTGTSSLLMVQGSGSGTEFGDYVSDAAALDTNYRFFVEVPPGLTRLVVDVFDADIGLGGGTEDTAGRDRARNTFNSAATYSLVAPNGTARNTLFTTGNTTTPTGSDNAWLSLFDSTGDTVRDNFTTIAYTNNDGTVNWAGNWIETNDDNDATAGDIRITGGELRIGDNNNASPSTIEREANLSGAGFTTATLSFNVRTTGVDAGDQMRLQVSNNGGGSWTTLETFNGPIAATTRSYNITTSIAANTRIRFIEVTGYGNNDFFFVDNLQIQATGILAGHWEVRVNMSSAATTGDDINAIGLRAHDGDATSGGTELPVYAENQLPLGVNPPDAGTSSRSYALYPWITSGCSASQNDFDYDSNSGTVGSVVYTSRTGSFSQSIASASLSANDTWNRDSFSGWTSDTRSTDYGVWTLADTITSYLVSGAPNGNYTTLYPASFQAAANPPAANPVTGGFRTYLPTDAGTAPVKPYLEQLLTFSGCGTSGPNPPVVGQTSCYTVTVRLTNPTPRSITFSAANLVTANVPGGGAVYAGTPQVSQGAVVSQPAVNGTGNITWNPGTVAAGATIELAYRVKVTPTSAGQRIPATGTAASGNGTRAQYLDETGNTTQARATYLFGPLCELAVTQGLLTEAVVSGFRATAAPGGGVAVEWSTASEAGTAGFYLYRWDGKARRWTPVHEGLLTGLIHEPQGGVYRLVDAGASPREPQRYLLEEVEAGGRRRGHGPYTVKVDWGRGGRATAKALETADYGREAAPAPGRQPKESGVPAKLARTGRVAASPAGLYLGVRDTGLYSLSAADVAAWFGMAQPLAESAILKGQLALTRGGEPVAWAPDPSPGPGKGAQGLLFYGQAPDSLYTTTAAYRLELRPGLTMDAAVAGSSPAVGTGIDPAPSFGTKVHAERDAFAATVIAPDPNADYWFWDFLQGDDPAFGRRTYALDAPGIAGAGSRGAVASGGALTVSLYGATDSGVAGEHRAAVSVNGVELGEARWQGIAPKVSSFTIPPGVLQPAGNQVEIAAHTGDGAPYSIWYVDSFDLAYDRTYRAAADSLTFTAPKGARVVVAGFSNPAVRLFDVGAPMRPRRISGAAVEADPAGAPGSYRLVFVPPGPGPYLATAAVSSPAGVRPWTPPSLLNKANRASYLVIAPAALHDAAERLAGLRRAQGLEAMVVDLDAVFDEVGAGTPDPHALRDFLAYAWGSWSLPPRYVVLAGAGTLDYRNLLGYGDDLVPPLLIRTPSGLFPSDNLLGDVDGDGRPEMAVGRIPALSAAELDAYVDKIAAYEAAPAAAWTGSALFLSDSPDGAADFAADSAGVSAQLPAGWSVERIDLASAPLDAARSQLLAALASGRAFVDYLGHGALDRLSAGGLLTSADVPSLANGERLPVVTAMTCTINRFAVPGIPALGELLVTKAGGGAAGVWGPTGLSTHGEARLLAARFYRAADVRLGDRILRAVAEFRDLGGDPDLPRIYDLLGDPALRLQTPAAASTAPSGPGE